MINSKYTTKVISKKDNCEGYWNYTNVGIFQDDKQIGEYQRNYDNKGPFFPFTIDGKDYAVYSMDYTATRIMELPSIKDIGGEQPASNGFCPTNYYIPTVRVIVYQREESYIQPANDKYFFACVLTEKDNDFDKEAPKYNMGGKVVYDEIHFLPILFVEGCNWGGPYLLLSFDLSNIADGKLGESQFICDAFHAWSGEIKDNINIETDGDFFTSFDEVFGDNGILNDGSITIEIMQPFSYYKKDGKLIDYEAEEEDDDTE